MGLILLTCSSCNNSNRSRESNQSELPNIVLIISDDQAWTDYGFMGHEFIETPHIDRLAEQGLTFTRGYVPTSLCRPSLASMVTGLYPHQHLILGNDPVILGMEDHAWDTDYLIQRADYNRKVIEYFEKLKCLPEYLKEAGYLSFQTGKWWEGSPQSGGFDSGMTHGDPRRGGRHGDEGLKIGRQGLDAVDDFIDHALSEEKPFFLWYAPFLPHTPHNPPDSLYNKYLPVAPTPAVAAYWANCEWLDITCGQLVKSIESKGISKQTLFIYVTDNGWVQDPDQPNRYMDGSKRSPYDNGIRTPIIFKWDGAIEQSMDTKSLVSSIDIVPTILNLLGIEKPDQMHGINVLAPDKLKSRKAVFGEIYAHDFSTIDASVYYRMVVTDHYKLIIPDPVNKPGEPIDLFDVIQDPDEQNNLASKNPQVVQTLQQMINQLWDHR